MSAHRVRMRCVAFGGLAAVVAAVAIIFVTTTGGSPASLASVAARTPAPRGARFWTVRSGQTLASIGAREGVAASDLQRLNPRLIAGALIPGQRVRLPGGR